jgi:ABC-type transport system involved in cytochrome c biogenesis permease subunit
MKRLFSIFSVITAVLLVYGFYQALNWPHFLAGWLGPGAPTEQTMGDVQRIFYYHVPSAWTGLLLFFINLIASAQYLANANPVTRKLGNSIALGIGVIGLIGPFVPQVQPFLPPGMRPSAIATTALAVPAFYFLIGRFVPKDKLDPLAVTTAEVGVVFCTIVLVTGPIWARPVWNIWWTWDLRLTSTLLLWLIYTSYLILRRFSSTGHTQIVAAVWAVFGALDVPFVYLSIWYFRGQHPSPVIGGSGSLHPSMLHALMINWLAFSCFAFLVCWARFRLEMLKREVDEAHAMESLAGAGAVKASLPLSRSAR